MNTIHITNQLKLPKNRRYTLPNWKETKQSRHMAWYYLNADHGGDYVSSKNDIYRLEEK